MPDQRYTAYPKKYAHGFCFAVLCCGYTLTDFSISIRLTSLALWQSNDCPSASKATLMNMDKYFMWIHYERFHNHNKAKHNKTVCIFRGIFLCRYESYGLQRTTVKLTTYKHRLYSTYIIYFIAVLSGHPSAFFIMTQMFPITLCYISAMKMFGWYITKLLPFKLLLAQNRYNRFLWVLWFSRCHRNSLNDVAEIHRHQIKQNAVWSAVILHGMCCIKRRTFHECIISLVQSRIYKLLFAAKIYWDQIVKYENSFWDASLNLNVCLILFIFL